MSKQQDEVQPIIVKKIKKGGGGHHGGAWKVAYADFVTAMMAFFLLLWLLNVTTSEQKMGIADYFDPNPKISDGKSGAGGVMGGLTVSPEGAMTSTQNPLMQLQTDNRVNPALRPGKDPGQSQKKGDAGQKDKRAIAKENAKNQRRAAEQRKFEETQRALEKAIESTPELKTLAKNLLIDTTPEGLRIQVIDQDGESMFASGSAEMYEKTRLLLRQVADIIKGLPNELSVRGHTDGVPYGSGAAYTNWELSSDRANASRRVLLEAGVGDDRLNNVVGKADTEHLVPENPADAKNRRISIMLLRQELTNPDHFKDLDEQFGDEEGASAEESAAEDEAGEEEGEQPLSPEDLPPIDKPFEDPLFEPTPGQVQFP